MRWKKLSGNGKKNTLKKRNSSAFSRRHFFPLIIPIPPDQIEEGEGYYGQSEKRLKTFFP